MSRIAIGQIEAFYWTAELGSVQKAAAKLNIAQPTVSLRLRQLEAELSAPMVERYGRGLRLTREGHAFLVHARSVIEAYQAMLSRAETQSIRGPLRIGLAEGFAIACLPLLIPALAKAFPDLQPEWTVATSSGLEQDLIDGHLDLTILVDAIGHHHLRVRPLGLQKTVWAASKTLEISGRASAATLSRFTVVTTPPPTPMHRATMGWFTDSGTQAKSLCICTSLSLAAQLVAAGLGIGVFPANMVAAYPLPGAIVPLVSDPPLPNGRVYVADRVTADAVRTDAVFRVFQAVTQSIGYFEGQGSGTGRSIPGRSRPGASGLAQMRGKQGDVS
jgi:DNA-binding transcriptional LysR family regulator